MGRAPCCDKTKVKRGPWSPDEDATLRNFVQNHGIAGNWISLPQKAGLKRCGKSCRLRWLNYLRPNLKHGGFTEEEDNIILTLYRNIGSRWSVIASDLPGRTDNDVKNYWNTKLKKKLLPTPNGTTITNNFSVSPRSSSSAISNIIYFCENSNLSNDVTTENTLPYNNSMANYFNPGISQNLDEAASSFSSSAFSLDDVGGISSDVMGLGSELTSFDYLFNDFDFQEIIPYFAEVPIL